MDSKIDVLLGDIIFVYTFLITIVYILLSF